jgi:DNA-binding MarR family transcriptional regulator
LNDRILKKYLADECITLAQCKFILVLHERGSACLGELSGEILLDSGSTSRMLERLRRKGLLTVARSNYDRRKIQITFTSSGHLLAAKTPRLTANAVGEVIAALTEDEIRAFERTLQKVFLSKR